jgi:hypothetical protein
MLGVSDETVLSEQGWAGLTSRVALPCSWDQYAAGAGAVRAKADSRRQYCRVGLRSIAIIWIDGQPHATYTTDVSRLGIGFYSPMHLLPRKLVKIWLPGRSILQLRIQRCRRVAEHCFECGAKFDLEKNNNGNAHDCQPGQLRVRVE